MPDFTIRGNPAAIRGRAATTRSKGQLFFDTGDALSRISVDGWTGRAADHFRDRHDLEPDRWTEAGNGFLRAGAALEAYAAAVEDAQRRAAWAEGEHARGDDVTASARSSYDADVARAREEQSNAVALGGTGMSATLTILPFDDPGQAIRQGALDELAAARADLDAAAHRCADEVRRGCADAPEEPGWLESGLRFVGGVLEGAGEAIWDLATLTPFSPVTMLQDLTALATGDLTPEELMAKYRLSVETAQGMLDALVEDPVGFGKELGKGLLDWDTWADDPARALGHLVPDAVVAVLTAGSGTAATRGVGSIDDVADGLRAVDRLEDATTLGRLDDLGDLGELGHLDDLGDVRHLDLDHITDWSRGGPLDADTPGAANYPDGYDRYGGLGEQAFHDRYWDPDARGGQGGWDYPTEADGYPDGFDGPARPNTTEVGDVLDRYGPEDGSFASPSGTPFDERALPPSSVGSGYTQYEVLEPLPQSVTEGTIAPWFEQPGGGVQYVFDHPISWYVEHGYLAKVD